MSADFQPKLVDVEIMAAKQKSRKKLKPETVCNGSYRK